VDRLAELPAALPGSEQGVLYQYVAMFEWGSNVKRATAAFVSALLGVRSATICPT